MADEIVHVPDPEKIPGLNYPRNEVWERLSVYGKTRAEKRALSLASKEVGFTMADAEFALRAHKGSIYHTANFLGVSRDVFKRYIQLNPRMLMVQKSIQEEKKDIAEYKLFEQVEESYFPAVSLFLRTIAKDRGYTERATLEHEMGPDATRNAASLIEAMKRGANLTKPMEEEVEWVELPLESHIQEK